MTKTASSGEVALVVVNYASHELIERTVDDGVTAASGIDLVLVDSFSSSAERGAARELAGRRGWSFVALDTNPGFGAAVNAGMDVAWTAGYDVVIMINPDAKVTAGVIAELLAECLRTPLAMVSPRIENSAGAVQYRGSSVDMRSGRIRSVPPDDAPAGARLELADVVAAPWRGWLPGTCLAVHRDLVTRIGGYDPRYFMYWEDVDLSVRCEQAGGTLVVRNDLVVVHDEGGTQTGRGHGAKSRLYYRWNCRNRLVFAGLHLGAGDLVRWLVATPRESWLVLLRGGGRRHVLRSPGDLLVVIGASLAGAGRAIAIATARALGRTTPLPTPPGQLVPGRRTEARR